MYKNIIFDLGGVLIDWNPRHLYRQLFRTEAEMEWFLAHVCSPDWNELQDAGRSFAEGIRDRIEKFPQFELLIRAWKDRYQEMLRGEIAGSVQILSRLHSQGRHRLLALTNWSVETYPVAQKLFPFLTLFEGIIVSGELRLKKPDPRIFQYVCDKYRVVPEETIFIDDMKRNTEAAESLGFTTVQFLNSENLAVRLHELGVLLA